MSLEDEAPISIDLSPMTGNPTITVALALALSIFFSIIF